MTGIRRAASAIGVLCLVAGCASERAQANRALYHHIEIGNAGVAVVRQFRIAYGDVIFPGGSNFEEIPPVHRTISSEGRVVPVPIVAEVSWFSADGVKHQVSVPIRQLMQRSRHFYGWKFYFVDDRLDVYLLSEEERLPFHYTERTEEKVFSG